MIQSFADVITIDEHAALTALASRTTFVSGRNTQLDDPRIAGQTFVAAPHGAATMTA